MYGATPIFDGLVGLIQNIKQFRCPAFSKQMLVKSEKAHFWRGQRPRHYTLEHRYGVVYCGSTCAFFRDSEEEVSVLENYWS